MFHSRLCQSFGTSVLWVLVIVLYQTCVNAQTFTDDWRTGCKALVGNVTDWQNAPGFVDQDGRAQPRFDPVTTWGITKERCDEVCSSKDLRYQFNIDNFATAVSNWLLPWLALTAQLPFETTSWFADFTSLFLAVGSPALITFSLTITILNRSHIQCRFEGLQQRASVLGPPHEANFLQQRLWSVQFLLKESQQAPLRLSQEGGWLSSLLLLKENNGWWSGVRRSLRQSRRKWTYSLVAQLSMAAAAFGLTVLSALAGELGDNSTALQLSSGTIWLWLLPIIMGWLTVGTQYTHGRVNEALVKTHPKPLRRLEDSLELTEISSKGEMAQRGILAKSGLTPFEHRTLMQPDLLNTAQISQSSTTNQNGLTTPVAVGDEDRDEEPARRSEKVNTLNWTRLDLCVLGDEPKEGPIFNHWRAFTWWKASETLASAFSKSLDTLQTEEQIGGTGLQLARHCGLGSEIKNDLTSLNSHLVIAAYYEWKDVPSQLWKNLALAAVASFCVQWGTTGPPILIAYETPTKGIGCRSGGFILYGFLATVSWVMIAISSLISHHVMLHYQRMHAKDPALPLDGSGLSLGHRASIFWAHATRIAGKMLAFCNAVWLLVRTFFEFAGFYDNCYCGSTALGLRSHAYVVLYADPKELRSRALGPWAGGLVFSVLVCCFSFGFFWLGSTKQSDDPGHDEHVE